MKRKTSKTITERKLTKLLNKAEGDWDFLVFLLDQYWDKKSEK